MLFLFHPMRGIGGGKIVNGYTCTQTQVSANKRLSISFCLLLPRCMECRRGLAIRLSVRPYVRQTRAL